MTFFVLEKLAGIDYREEIMTPDEEKIKFDAEQTKAWFPKEPKSKKQFIAVVSGDRTRSQVWSRKPQ